MNRLPGSLLDLSKVPVPDAIKDLDYEAIVTAMLADLKARLYAADIPWDVDHMETDPLVITEESRAARELYIMARINDAIRAVMLPSATGKDLEAIASDFGLQRLVIREATDTSPAVMESDDSLRYRRHLAPDGYAAAGPERGYEYFALSADGSIREARPIHTGEGRVDLILLSREGDGSVSSDIITKVHAALSPRNNRPMTDALYIRSAAITDLQIRVRVQLSVGPDANLIRNLVVEKIRAYVESRRSVGKILYVDGIIGAARQAGPIETVEVLQPTADVDPGIFGAVNVTEYVVEVL